MKHVKSIGIIIALGLIIMGGVLVWKMVDENKNQTTQINPNQSQPAQQQNGPITVNNLTAGQTITTPIIITGTVAGNWFFEGSFPVLMKDASGNQIGVALAHTSDDWMTTNQISFSVTLPATNYTGPGTVVFTKDNPSGEPQFDASYSVAVTYQ